jgi:hypothetical protein
VGISEQRGSAIAAGQWECVHIPQGRTFDASCRTFLAMLNAENSTSYDPRTEYPIYSARATEGDGICIFFSPPAAQRFRTLIKFWLGIPFHEPRNLKVLWRVL